MHSSAILTLRCDSVDRVTVQRYDSVALPAQSFERTPQGGIKAPARFTRVGVLEYDMPDGSTRREWRPPEEVFRAESYSTLEDAPITVHHPETGEVRADSYQRDTVGHVRSGVAPEDGQYLAGTVVVQDESTVRGAVAGSLGEISAGYKSQLEMTSGVVPEGQPDAGKSYDCIQRNIIYNHVALLPRGLGRAGSEVSLRLDSNGHQLPMEGHHMELTPEEFAALKALLAKKAAATTTDTVDDPEKKQDSELTPEEIVALKALLAKRTDTEDPEKKTDTEEPEKRADTDTEKKVDTEDPEKKTDSKRRLSSVDQERIVLDSIDLRDQARTVLGAEYSFAGKTNRQVMVDTVTRVDSKIQLKNRSDDALRALFDASVPRFVERQAAQRNEHFGLRSVVHTDSAESDDDYETSLHRRIGAVGKKAS